MLPSVLWRCWLGGRKGIRSVKNMGGWWRWVLVSRMEWRPAGWSVCLPLLIFPCTIKSRSSLMAPAYPGGPGKRAIKRLCVCVCDSPVNVCLSVLPEPNEITSRHHAPTYIGNENSIVIFRLDMNSMLLHKHRRLLELKVWVLVKQMLHGYTRWFFKFGYPGSVG